jgi:hypothetical protein
MNQGYIDTVGLLLAIAPQVVASPRFAIKGGTALNLFVQDMPRLSVDIDLVFTDHSLDRETALDAIGKELGILATTLERQHLTVHRSATAQGDEVKILVESNTARVKVEVNFVYRGTLLPAESRLLVASAQELFTTAPSVTVLATPELYGSKLVAAMDRQHPRDVFDVRQMLNHPGWSTSIIDCFVAYLAGHNRPVHEVLFPAVKSLEPAFSNEFQGMTRTEVTHDALVQTQVQLVRDLPRRLTGNHREFLLSLVAGEPAWDRMPFSHLKDLPALRWKLHNLGKLRKSNPRRFTAQHDELAAHFATLS